MTTPAITTLVAPTHSGFRQALATLIGAVRRGSEIEAQAAADLVVSDGVSQGALWKRGLGYDFVPAASAEMAEALSGRSYGSRSDFIETARQAGVAVELSPIRF